jgi:hypothetical protein
VWFAACCNCPCEAAEDCDDADKLHVFIQRSLAAASTALGVYLAEDMSGVQADGRTGLVSPDEPVEEPHDRAASLDRLP